MQKNAEPSPLPSAAALMRPPLRVVPAVEPTDPAREELIRRLAADRLRDLRDDGVTRGYVARMYEVDPTLLESVASELLPGQRD